MMRTHRFALLLFSFCLLFFGCAKKTVSLEEIALSGEWDTLLQASQRDFSRTYQRSALYYQALAQYMKGDSAQALASLELYLALSEGEQPSLGARTLIVATASNRGKPELVIEHAKALAEQDALQIPSAQAWYRALVETGQGDEANRVFLTHLRSTLDEAQYAQLLVESKANGPQLKQAFAHLSLQQVFELLRLASVQNGEVDWMTDVLALAREYEQLEMTQSQRKLLYVLLAQLSAKAEQRVLANKYTTLAESI
ncbi:MAG: hypothetical protein EOM32_05955 [Spirochaetia bacterium]|nr:hypothetical protein [Spirochaetia bacterium]